MVNPRAPHIIGIALDSQGVAVSKVILTNQTTGDIAKLVTDASKRAVFDCSSFTNGYTNGDVIEVENIGASYGGATITINTGLGLQTTTVDSTAAASVNLSM